MPAYVYIQCFTKYKSETFGLYIDKFTFALKDLGFGEQYIKNFVDVVKWQVADNGFMYDGCNMPPERINIKDNTYSVRPLIMGFTPQGYEGLTEDWVEFSVLFDEDEVTKDYGTGEMYENSKHAIWHTCNLISKYFPSEVVFLTDEVTDAYPWEALIGVGDNLYYFDLAIIPNELMGVYKSIPQGFKKLETSDKTYIAQMRVWSREPWDY